MLQSNILLRCLQLNILNQSSCAGFSLATDFYGYGYTSYENFTEIATSVEMYSPFLKLSYHCHQFAAYFICNYAFIPCDLFTGAPRSICSDSCYYFRTRCNETYDDILLYGGIVAYPFIDNCENTLIHLQTTYGFPCSSSTFENNCIDVIGR